AAAPLNIGFLTVLQEASGQLGGYLVTNCWGRPLEFRLSTAVQPNRVQQVLYGPTLQAYICADLIGKTLFDKTTTPVNLVIAGRAAALDLRLKTDVPVLLRAGRAPSEGGIEALPAKNGRGSLLSQAQFAQEGSAIRPTLQRLDDILDLAEPFGRIREAIGE